MKAILCYTVTKELEFDCNKEFFLHAPSEEITKYWDEFKLDEKLSPKRGTIVKVQPVWVKDIETGRKIFK